MPRFSLKLSGLSTRGVSTSTTALAKAAKPPLSPVKARRKGTHEWKEGEQVTKEDFISQYLLPNMPGGEVFYMPTFIDRTTADRWYKALDALDTWYHPMLKVHGKTLTQSRSIAAYAVSPDLVVKYSGTTVMMHHPYPPVLEEIQEVLQEVLGVEFNHVMLNRYEDGSVSIGRHSDTLENKVIASISLGAERQFILRPREKSAADPVKLRPADGSLLVMQGDTQINWKHEIPRETTIKRGRISLTFRQIYP
ncbi:hypothetical protein CALVIDRAFT_534674 [Calocera viscosa TUFC12733]|uniref:Fe2OG dioxygenase domain-containing protein n=1 Tax=Calocera viscosa (strain TUFC12733) TaxID=1330018 RepID=A0A167PU85_CALVF|nr:hypothetical protein CALVIDRAFT_534674 [Calocera viscosa TUFC12733]